MSAAGPASSISSHAGAQLGQQISLSVANKVQNAAKAQGDAVISLLQAAAQVAQQGLATPGKGQNIDVLG